MTNLGDKIGGFFSDLGDKLGNWFDKLGEKLKEIGEFIIDIPGNIIDLLEKLLKKLFIPDEGFFDSQVQEVRDKFSFADSLCGTAENVLGAMSGESAVSLASDSDIAVYSDEPDIEVYSGGGHGFDDSSSGSGGGSSFGTSPQFTFDFSSAKTHWNYGGSVVRVNLDWLSPYRETIQALIRAFVWVVFIINTYKDLPNIINGFNSSAISTANAAPGGQGNGKTIAMVEYGLRMKKEYPLSKLITNLCVSGEDDILDHWKKLVTYSNGSKGVICLIDETQNWFSSTQSRNFPPEMLQVITQNRKNRRIILGTAQNFYLLAKAIRSQCTEVRECRTFFGCITLVRRKEPILDAEGNVTEWDKKGSYFFVHDRELRDSYDTYKVIEALSHSGFKDGADVLNRSDS